MARGWNTTKPKQVMPLRSGRLSGRYGHDGGARKRGDLESQPLSGRYAPQARFSAGFRPKPAATLQIAVAKPKHKKRQETAIVAV